MRIPPEAMAHMIRLTEEKHAENKAKVDLENPETIAEYFAGLFAYKVLHNADNVETVAAEFLELTAHMMVSIAHNVSSLPRAKPSPMEVLDHLTEGARIAMVNANMHLRLDTSDEMIRAKLAEVMRDRARKQ